MKVRQTTTIDKSGNSYTGSGITGGPPSLYSPSIDRIFDVIGECAAEKPEIVRTLRMRTTITRGPNLLLFPDFAFHASDSGADRQRKDGFLRSHSGPFIRVTATLNSRGRKREEDRRGDSGYM